jgi:putative addiction module killer protein
MPETVELAGVLSLQKTAEPHRQPPHHDEQLPYYLTAGGESPVEGWFSDLGAAAAAKVSVALVRLEQGNTSNAKGVGEGVLEYRIDWGPGYRVYFGRDGEALVILLMGGTKQRQQRDIERRKSCGRTTSGVESRQDDDTEASNDGDARF